MVDSSATRSQPRRPPDARWAEARARLAEGRPEEALALADRRLAERPGDLDGLYFRFRALERMGERSGALAALAAYLAQRKAATAEATMAEHLIEDGLEVEAEALLRARLARGDQYSARFTLTKLLLLQGRVLEAGEELERLYAEKERVRSPLRRADYLAAMRLGILGDLDGLEALRARLEKGGVRPHRLRFFEILRDLLATGDLESFSARRAEIHREVRKHPFYGPLYRDLRPEAFLPGGRLRWEARRVLGARGSGPTLDGPGLELLDEEERTMVPLLFEKFRRVRLEPLESGPDEGRSGDRVLRVYPEGAGIRHISSLLKIGPKHRILVEREKVERFVQEVLHPRNHPTLLGATWTLRRGALRFAWGVSDREAPRSLRAIYAEESPAKFGETLDRLLGESLAPWYEENAAARGFDPAPLAKWIAEGLERATAHLLVEEGVDLVADYRRLARILQRTTLRWGVRHGDLNLRNVLVPPSGIPVLIDFTKSGPGAIWEDLARIEADIRYEADPATAASIDEVSWMDGTLVSPKDLGAETALDYRRSLERRFLSTRRIRSWAARTADGAPPVVYHLFVALAVARLLYYGHLDEPARRAAGRELRRIYEAAVSFVTGREFQTGGTARS